MPARGHMRLRSSYAQVMVYNDAHIMLYTPSSLGSHVLHDCPKHMGHLCTADAAGAILPKDLCRALPSCILSTLPAVLLLMNSSIYSIR